MATMKLDAGFSTRSIAGEEGDPDPDPEETANQHSDSDPGADKVSDIVQLDLSVSKDDTDPPIRERAQDVVRAREQGKSCPLELKTTIDVVLLAFILRGRQSSIGVGGTNASEAVVPDFQIEDGSFIQVRETKNEFQRQLALKPFSARCIESSVSIPSF